MYVDIIKETVQGHYNFLNRKLPHQFFFVTFFFLPHSYIIFLNGQFQNLLFSSLVRSTKLIVDQGPLKSRTS